jgi:hypothetical protein
VAPAQLSDVVEARERGPTSASASTSWRHPLERGVEQGRLHDDEADVYGWFSRSLAETTDHSPICPRVMRNPAQSRTSP